MAPFALMMLLCYSLIIGFSGLSRRGGIVEGEPMMLGFIVHDDAKTMMSIARFEEEVDRIVRIRSYNFSPELLQEVGAALGYNVGQVPYRFPAP